MSQQREKFTATTTLEKSCNDKSFVQLEGELTEAQLEAIALPVGERYIIDQIEKQEQPEPDCLTHLCQTLDFSWKLDFSSTVDQWF